MGREQVINAQHDCARKGNAGFTLVETLVVLAVLAFVAGVIVINAPPPRSVVQDEAEIFAARLQHAVEMATLGGEQIRVEFNQSAYSFLRFAEGQWRSVENAQLRTGEFSFPYQLEGAAKDPSLANARALNGVSAEEDENIILGIDPIGGAQSFSLNLGSDPVFVVSLNAAGDVSVQRGEQ